jgi:hypothetical protein
MNHHKHEIERLVEKQSSDAADIASKEKELEYIHNEYKILQSK